MKSSFGRPDLFKRIDMPRLSSYLDPQLISQQSSTLLAVAPSDTCNPTQKQQDTTTVQQQAEKILKLTEQIRAQQTRR
jgi:hypothetical protein